MKNKVIPFFTLLFSLSSFSAPFKPADKLKELCQNPLAEHHFGLWSVTTDAYVDPVLNAQLSPYVIVLPSGKRFIVDVYLSKTLGFENFDHQRVDLLVYPENNFIRIRYPATGIEFYDIVFNSSTRAPRYSHDIYAFKNWKDPVRYATGKWGGSYIGCP